LRYRFFIFIACVIVVSMAGGCAGNPANQVPLEEKVAKLGFTIGQPVKRINDYQINGWNTVDLKHVVMSFGASRNYLLTLRTSCDGVLSAQMLFFSTTVGFLTDRDKLLVRDGGSQLSHCYIRTIHELEKIKTSDKSQ